MRLTTKTLSGEFVQLEPMDRSHKDGLAHAAQDPRIWRTTPLGASFDTYFEKLLTLRDAGSQIPFAVRWLENNTLMGASRLMDIVPEHKRVEIGGTWYHPDHWGGPTNPEAKLLLLTHAFENAGANRVQLVTDVLNRHSQSAIAKLGAKREGVLRSHMLVDGARRRDSMVFSIVREEWPQVKAGLRERLGRLESASE